MHRDPKKTIKIPTSIFLKHISSIGDFNFLLGTEMADLLSLGIRISFIAAKRWGSQALNKNSRPRNSKHGPMQLCRFGGSYIRFQ